MIFRRLLVCSLLAIPASVIAADNPIVELETPTIEVVGTTPLPTLVVPRDQVPGNVQGGTSNQIEAQQPLHIADFITQNAGNVTINEYGSNPFQPDVNYRGFTASPLLGTPQGLSVFQDGVRINEPFGDIVNWDLIPESAVSAIHLIPGSNPLYGLNTLGGALAIRTKSGSQFPGFEAEAGGGSFGRRVFEFEYGGAADAIDYYFTGNLLKEDGWRDFSPSDVRKFFAKIGHETETTDFDLSLTLADNDMVGNELLPLPFYKQRRESVYTRPDQTINEMSLVNLTWSHYFDDATQIAGNVYHRRSDRRGLNGDTNDDFEGGANDGEIGANGGQGFNRETGVNNRTTTEQRGSGFALQWSKLGAAHKFTAGTSYDRSRSTFSQSEQEGIFDDTRAIIPTDDEEIENRLVGKTENFSLYATDNYTLAPATHITVSARYNRTHVQSKDQIRLSPPNLDGDFTYTKFNPAIGITHRLAGDSLTTFASLSQGNRAPSPVELGCADPANPCTLPNALGSDPFLKQVVARTVEAGIRGRPSMGQEWSLSAFSTVNKDDIIFVSTSAAAGFFTNFGETQLVGLEANYSGKFGPTSVDLSFGLIKATFESSSCLLSENNSSRGTSTQCAADDEIFVAAGNSIPGIPEQNLKLNLGYAASDRLSLGLTAVWYSDHYVRGNENNQHQAGRFTDRFGNLRNFLGSGEVDGYATVNLRATYQFSEQLEVFARLNNLFDEEYFTAGALAENVFGANGRFLTNSDDWTNDTFFAPGAPRALWVGLRYAMEREKQR